ncbi:hypothetical protein KAT92_01425 [Candidatus Babeliales bacterium]|nr:hypothetical protein [Candidatus Babeliales bacterium]
MKFKVDKFALAAAAATTLFYFIKHAISRTLLFYGVFGTKGMMYGYGWRMMDAVSRAKSVRPSIYPWSWYSIKLVIVFAATFAAAWFFAWFYNKLISKK